MALLGLLLINGRLRWWLLGGMILSLALSWGKNLDALTHFFVEYVPLYNKFRAVSSIQVILELLIPIAAVFGIHRFFNDRISDQEKVKKFLISLGVLGGLCLIFWLFGGSLFSFKSASETRLEIEQPLIFDAIKEDRITIMKSDSLRSLIYILLVAGVLWFTLKKKFSENIGILCIGVLILVDLVTVDRRSVNEEGFISKRKYSTFFQPTPVDKEIMKDPSYFRVLDQARGFNNSHTNYFFNSLNGYSAVRPRKMEDLYYEHIAKGNLEAVNMLNVKYVIQQNREGALDVQQNPSANGPAWFVEELKFVTNYKEEFDALNTIDTKKTAVIREAFRDQIGSFNITKDSVSTISISKTTPNHLGYNVYANNPGFVVFSETYYKDGWKAYIDDQLTTIYPVDYMLRGIKVPAGKHTIEFVFDPQVVKTGSSITLTSSIIFVLLILGGIWYQYRKTGSFLSLTKEDM